MELILNDYSVSGQFISYDAFADYVLDVLAPILDLVIENQISFLKRQSFYECKITKELSLNDILMHTGDPVIYKIRNYISQLGYQQPYWDDFPLTQQTIKYQYSVEDEEPNCFTEAIERKGALLSFPSDEYDTDIFLCKRDDETVVIQNVKERKSFLYTYLLENIRNIRYVLEKNPFCNQTKIVLATVKGKCYAEEALLNNGLNLDDMQRIFYAIPRMIDGLTRGEKNDYWDMLRNGIFEFRIHVSSNRIFRLLFFQRDGIVFLNGFIKKTQTTPKNEIEKAETIKKQYLERLADEKR